MKARSVMLWGFYDVKGSNCTSITARGLLAKKYHLESRNSKTASYYLPKTILKLRKIKQGKQAVYGNAYVQSAGSRSMLRYLKAGRSWWSWSCEVGFLHVNEISNASRIFCQVQISNTEVQEANAKGETTRV